MKGMNCIIADDHGMLRKGLSELLKSIDPSLDIVKLGTFMALEAQFVDDPGADLVLLDVVISVISGMEGLCSP